jgi:PKD repeat protein
MVLKKLFVAQPWQSTGRKPEKICWDFGDGKDTCIVYNMSISNNYAVYHKYDHAGTYKVCLKILYSGGCVASVCKELKIENPEVCSADIKLETLSASGSTKQFIAITANNQQKKPALICWKFGDGKDTCIQYSSTYTGHYTVNHTYARGGEYEACVKIIYAGGCEASKCKLVVVSNPVTNTCSVQIREIATVAEGLQRYFNAVPVSGLRPEKICWSFGDGKDTCINLAATINPQHLTIGHKYLAPGVYKTCVKIVYAGGCIAHQCHELVIRGHNNVCGGYFTDSAANPQTIIFKGFSINNSSDQVLSYRWVFGDGSMGSGPQVKHEYKHGGTYQVCLFIKTASGCETRICKNIFLHGRTNASQIQLNPNPVIHHLHVQFHSLHKETVLVSIFNANGVLVRNYSRNAALGANTWDFDLSGLPTGIYSIVIRSPKQLASSVFFKQ